MKTYIDHNEKQADFLRAMPELLKNSDLADAFLDYEIGAQEDMTRVFSTKENVVDLIEVLKKEDWRQLRAYLTVLKEHLQELDQGSQEIILDFLYDILSHRSGMVRRIAAATYGYLMAYRRMQYGISPDDEIRRVLFPGNSVNTLERRRISYQLKYIFIGFGEIADENAVRQMLNNYARFFKSSRWDKVSCFYLIMGIVDIPCDKWSNLQKFHIFSFLRNNLTPDNEEVRLAALHLIEVWLAQGWQPAREIIDFLSDLKPVEEAKFCECYMVEKIQGYVGKESSATPHILDGMDVLRLFQENQHSHALWINKILNLSILKDYFFTLQDTGKGDDPYCFQYANHLISTLRLSKQAVVFLQAGQDLMDIMPYLPSYHKFEMMKDIFQSLENIDDYYNFMAPFAGRAFICLDPLDQQELIPRIWELADRSDVVVVNTTLEVVAEIVKDFYTDTDNLEGKSPEERAVLKDVAVNLCSILSTGMASYKPRIAKEAFFLTGQRIFSHVELSDEIAVSILLRLARKALISLNRKKSYADDFYNYSAVAHIADNLRKNADFINRMEEPRKIAFFSGSFDPFSRGHKAIAREVAEMGYTVYLDAHDFSWYKKLQPMEIRRQIIYLSISDLENVLLFPEEYPISIENPGDLAFLKSLFPDCEVTIVAGSDMIESCEAYWKEPEPDSIHTFPHIIFQRGAGISRDLVDPLIRKETIFLRLPAYFETMTSDEIQKQIASGRDISDMVDHQVVNYVMDKKLYRSEPIYKKMARTRAVDFGKKNVGKGRCLSMTESIQGYAKTVGSVYWHERRASDIYEDCGSLEETRILRQYISGRLLVITALNGETEEDRMIVCNELFAYYQKKEYAYGICFDPDESVLSILKRFGFIRVPEGNRDCYYVDLSHPVVMFYDADSFIKEEWWKEPLVTQAIAKGRKRLYEVLPDLYPGSLVLHFDAPVLNYQLARLITKANNVSLKMSGTVDEEGELVSYEAFGEKLCVPFGKLLKGVLIPNTVTKELSIEKLYESDLHTFDIYEYPEYEPLRTQIRTVKAFHRPVIFVDDIYHKGHRMRKISRFLEEEGLMPDCFLVGVLSGQGKDLAREYQLEVDAPYFIPDMKAWIVESDLYPFVGGDGIVSDEDKQEGIVGLPSTNLILPYQMPSFFKGTKISRIYALSETAIINSRGLFEALETLYRQRYYHTLTFGSIGEVMSEPRYPEGAIALIHNNQPVSELLTQELARLHRLNAISLY